MDASGIFLTIIVSGLALTTLSLFAVAHQRRRLRDLYQPREWVNLGQYVTGLRGVSYSLRVDCAITATELILLDHPSSRELARIQLALIRAISVDTSRVGIRRIFTLKLEWQDQTSGDRAAIFDFTGPDAQRRANTAVEKLGAYIPAQHDGVRSAEPTTAKVRIERDCPYCAEPILAAAKVCKHCGHAVEVLPDAGASAATPAPNQPIGVPHSLAGSAGASAPSLRPKTRPPLARRSSVENRGTTKRLGTAGVIACVTVVAVGLLMHVVSSKTPDSTATQGDSAAVGMCYTNRTSGSLIGRITALTVHPAYQSPAYLIRGINGDASPLYMPPADGEIATCPDSITAQFARADSEARKLNTRLRGKRFDGLCVFQEDGQFVGRVSSTEGPDPAGGTHVTVKLARKWREGLGMIEDDFVLPRDGTSRRCSRSLN